ncbi:MAG: hypothetical protein ACP5I1_19760, partial [Candidatus Hinthialibacter sp.]
MFKIHSIFRAVFGLKRRVLLILLVLPAWLGGAAFSADLWEQAQANRELIRFSTLFTAQDVRNFLAKPDSLQAAVQWCKDTAVTHVFLETFRGNYTAERDVLLNAKKKFEEEGFEVSGCVTTTN